MPISPKISQTISITNAGEINCQQLALFGDTNTASV
jgi:hypothetical protein